MELGLSRRCPAGDLQGFAVGVHMSQSRRWSLWLPFVFACSAFACSSYPTPTPTPTTQEEVEPTDPAPAAQCEDVGESEPFHRTVAGAHRACTDDAECAGVHLDCSNLRCSAVQRQHLEAQPPLDCDGYAGPVGNYDCLERFGSQRAVCRQGCCVSLRSCSADSECPCGACTDGYCLDSCE